VTGSYVLKAVRYALNLDDPTMLEIFRTGGYAMDAETLSALLKKEDERGYIACSSDIMGSFLDGLIIHKRGVKETLQSKTRPGPLTNNDILKKLRIALELKEADMLNILKLGNVDVSKSELSALFRKKGHKHYKECGDQFLRYFLKGLAVSRGR
jgi:uncharacterized protein YehS (DUF1456 family)